MLRFHKPFNLLTGGKQAESLIPRIRLPFRMKCLLALAGNVTQVAEGKLLEDEVMQEMGSLVASSLLSHSHSIFQRHVDIQLFLK